MKPESSFPVAWRLLFGRKEAFTTCTIRIVVTEWGAILWWAVSEEQYLSQTCFFHLFFSH
jgi:hypothetical protein